MKKAYWIFVVAFFALVAWKGANRTEKEMNTVLENESAVRLESLVIRTDELVCVAADPESEWQICIREADIDPEQNK